jgi:zinc protease
MIRLKYIYIVGIVMLFSIGATPVWAQAKVQDVDTFMLDNGMKFILLEDHSIPNVAMYIFFKVGSRNESPGITGLSHFFEHMMFNGAKKYGPKMFDRVMEAAGGANNAYTSENVTVYSDWFPASSQKVIFDLEADRIGNLALDDRMVASEREVVMSERITGLENSSFRLLYEQLKAVAFYAHPYRWPVIGYESDIKNWTKDDLQNYFNTYYAPNNAVVVMAGDLTVSEIKALAKTYFEPIPSRKPPRPVHTAEPPQLGEKRLAVKKNVSSPHLLLAYHVPKTGSDDYYALTLLDSILSEGKSSRLYRAIVSEQQLAVSIFSFLPDALDPTLFYIYAICAKGVEAGNLETAIYREIDKIISEGVAEKELQKAKNNRLMDFYRGMQTISGMAENLGSYEIFYGSYEKMFTVPREYKRITPEDIRTVAARYLIKSNRTVGILDKGKEKES